MIADKKQCQQTNGERIQPNKNHSGSTRFGIQTTFHLYLKMYLPPIS